MEKSERKIKWNALASFLLALLLCAGAAGCSDDEENEPREEIILRDDFEEYGIPENYSKSVWFSAEVTNIGKTAAPEEHPFGTITPVIRKAYLLDL